MKYQELEGVKNEKEAREECKGNDKSQCKGCVIRIVMHDYYCQKNIGAVGKTLSNTFSQISLWYHLFSVFPTEESL